MAHKASRVEAPHARRWGQQVHQSVIDLQAFANLFDELSDVAQHDTGSLLSTNGRHPTLGSVVVLQDIAPGLILLSEQPRTGA